MNVVIVAKSAKASDYLKKVITIMIMMNLGMIPTFTG